MPSGERIFVFLGNQFNSMNLKSVQVNSNPNFLYRLYMNRGMFILFIFLTFTLLANAGTIVVQNTNNSGSGSLRQAVIDTQSGDTIRFNPNLINSGSSTIVLTSDITFYSKQLVFKGLYNANDTLYISGNNTNRIFSAYFSLPNLDLVIDSLVLINGYVSGAGANGGAIFCSNAENLFVSNSIIRNNSAPAGYTGGGIAFGGNLSWTISATITNCMISGNSGGGISCNTSTGTFNVAANLLLIKSTIKDNQGIGISSASYNNSTITINNCTVSGNISSSLLAAGIYSYSQTGVSSVVVNNSTISGNSALNQGAAIYSRGQNELTSSSSVIVKNSTVTGNSAIHIGGIYSYCDRHSSVQVTNSTISGNENGGIHSEAFFTSSLVVKSSIVALNTGWDASHVIQNAPHVITSNGFNIFGLIMNGGSVASDQMNATAAQLNLGPLQFNGGNTKTMLPGVGSIAIDMGNPTDLSAAQNAPLTGTIRDVGAAEVCSTTYGDTIASACDSINWYGTVYAASGNYSHQLINEGGCDSVLTLHLTINTPTTGTDIHTACDSFTWIDGNVYTSSTNTPTFVLQNAAGCDSTVTLNLTILSSTYLIENQTACDSYTWPYNGITYTTSGQYTDTLLNTVGCDSIIVLNLTINSTASITQQSACGTFTWTNGQIYTSSGSYSQTLTNTAGCDSIATLNLTIFPVSETTESMTNCGPFTWSLNGQTYPFSGAYTDTVQSVNGCDSIIHLNLTIFTIPNPNVVDNGNGTFTTAYSGIVEWIDCSTNSVVASGQLFAPLQNGNYSVIVLDGVTSCRDTSDCFLVDYLDLESKNLLDLSISPNPTTNQVHISFSGSDADLTVYDVQGKVVLTDKIQNQGMISLENLEHGVYLFDFRNSSGHNVKRVVKQ